MKAYKLNYSKKQCKNFINIGAHEYNIFCTNGKATIPMTNNTIRACESDKTSIAMKGSINTPMTKEEFNERFPQIAGKKYIASKQCARRAMEFYGRNDIIFADGEQIGNCGWFYTF